MVHFTVPTPKHMAVPLASEQNLYSNDEVEAALDGVQPPWLHGALERADVDRLMKENGNVEGQYLDCHLAQ